MKKTIALFASALLILGCAEQKFDASSVADATPEQIQRVEPLNWWVGMKTDLQILVQGPGISEYEIAIEGGKGVKLTQVHKADNPNFLFLDVRISPSAEAGTYWLVFSKEGEVFKQPYEIAQRREGSAERESFTTKDLIYLIMPDRFANGDPSNDSTPQTSDEVHRDQLFGRHGGDLQGIIDHLDYIAGLGVTAIWCTPLLEDNQPEHSYHGYACTDYYHIDPRFGSNELFRTYVQEAHKRGIKVIMDIVTNHCGSAHWWMQDMPFEDWVHQFDTYTGSNILFSANYDPNVSSADLFYHESGWFDKSMPDMNLDNPYVLQYFKQYAAWWAEWSDLDGFRVDTYPYNEKEPMSQWCASIAEEYPNMNVVGEVWTSSIPQLAYWQRGANLCDGFDTNLKSVMDFPLYENITGALREDEGGWGHGMVRVYDCLAHDFVHKDLSNMLIFVGNHDTDRIGDVVNGDADRLKIANVLLATLRGYPQVFAGDELMFRSCDLSMGHGGLRVDFPGGWPGDRMDLFSEEGRAAAYRNTNGEFVPRGQAADLHDHFAKLFNWRKGKRVIHEGKTMHFMTRDNTYAYFRYMEDGSERPVFVYVNNNPYSVAVPWQYYSEITAGLEHAREVISGEEVSLSEDLVVAPKTAIILEF